MKLSCWVSALLFGHMEEFPVISTPVASLLGESGLAPQ